MKEWVISPSDFLQALKKAKKLLFVLFLITLSLTFLSLLRKPILYRASGIFKGSNSEAKSAAKTLQVLSGIDSGIGLKDASDTLLDSYQVLKRVVLSLDLQGHLVEKKRWHSPLRTPWKNIKTALTVSRLKKNLPPSSILHRDQLIAEKALFQETPPLLCSKIVYEKENYSLFNILFKDENRYSLLDKKGRELIEGRIGVPLHFEEATFTLLKNGDIKLQGRRFLLSLIPLEAATEGLKKGLKIVHDKKKPSLIEITFSHPNPILAKEIVNKVMLSYFLFLQEEGEEKINKQTGYLEKRKKEAFEAFETNLLDYEKKVAEHVEHGGFLNPETEFAFLLEEQSLLQLKLNENENEFTKVYESLFSQRGTLEDRVKQCATLKKGDLTSIEGAKNGLGQMQKELDEIQLNLATNLFWQESLQESKCELAALSKSINDPTLNSLFESIHDLYFKLNDQANFSQKERQIVKEELEVKKNYLLTTLKDLKIALLLKKEILEENLKKTKEGYLSLLSEEQNHLKQRLRALGKKGNELSAKLQAKKKSDLKNQINEEMVSKIAQMVETRNIAFHMEALESTPLQFATTPQIPVPPFFIKKICLWSFVVQVFACLILFARQIQLGPTASFSNLKALEKKVLGKLDEEETLDETLEFLKKSGSQTILLLSQCDEPFYSKLLSALHKSQKRFSILNYSPKFQEELDILKKEYDFVFIASFSHPKTKEVKTLLSAAEVVIFISHGERMEQLPLPQKTLFICGENKTEDDWEGLKRNVEKKVLKEIVPLLERLKTKFKQRSSSSISS